MKLENVKGTFDYSKKEQEIREYIKDTLKKIFKACGYAPLETPLICYFDLLTLKYAPEDEILKEIFKVTDRGNRELGLRYDLTVPFAKFIAMEKNLRLPFKRYEIGEAFRDGPVKVGRNRQFVQCDVDVVGLAGAEIEAELISIFINGFNEFKIPIEIKYNSRNLMKGLIEVLNIDDLDLTAIIKTIDKMDKISEEDLKQELAILGIDNKRCALLLKYFNMDFDCLLTEFEDTNNDSIKLGLKEIKALNEILDYQGYMQYMKFTPTLARGQEYYTGNVFEVYATDSEIKSSIGSGGRYDKMITDWIEDGNNYPAVGISFGLNVIYEVLKNCADFKNKNNTTLYIIPLNTFKEALSIANQLRNLNINVEIEMQAQKIKKSFEYANKENIPYVMVLGENELKEGSIKIKEMSTGIEAETNMDNITEILTILKK